MGECLTLGDFERYTRGEMSPPAAAQFEQHVKSCARCRQTYDSFRADKEFVERVRGHLASPIPAELQRAPTSPPNRPAETLTSPTLLPGSNAAPPSVRERLPQIEGYAIKRVIGRGGMGVVYEAIQTKLSRAVALKLLPAVTSSAHPELIARFQREAAAAGRLHHTNIIPIYDFGESLDGYYYAMELLDGLSLAVVIKRLGRLDTPLASTTALAEVLTAPDSGAEDTAWAELTSEGAPSGTGSSTGGKGRLYYRQVAHWMAHAAEALHYAHLQGMVHRDIKPGNLMLCRDGRIVILDFGLVKTADERSVTATGSLVGTYRYMSPEQIGAKRITIDARSDVYSLGATMYELLTFQPAFQAREQSELLSQILFKEPCRPRKVISSVPVDLQTICLKAMEKSPSARYQTAQAMAEDLNSYLLDMAIRARPQGPLRRAVKFVRRRRVESVVVLAIVLVLSAGLSGAHFYRQAQAEKRDRLMKEGIAHFQDDWQRAEDAFRKVLTMNPDDYAALVDLANLYQDQYRVDKDAGHLDQADVLLERAVAVDPRRNDAWNAKGVLYQTLNRPADAVAAYERIRALDENYYPVWVNLALLHATHGNLLEAECSAAKGAELVSARREEVRQRPELLDSHLMAWRVLAAIQSYLGREQVEESLTSARNLSQNKDAATVVLCAQHYLRQGGAQNARQALDWAVFAAKLIEPPACDARVSADETQTSARAKRTLALARLRNEEWQLAFEAAQGALAAGDPQPAYAHFVIAIAAAHLNDVNAARDHVRIAEADWPEALRNADVCFSEDGKSLWFDTAAELKALQTDAIRLIEAAPGAP